MDARLWTQFDCSFHVGCPSRGHTCLPKLDKLGSKFEILSMLSHVGIRRIWLQIEDQVIILVRICKTSWLVESKEWCKWLEKSSTRWSNWCSSRYFWLEKRKYDIKCSWKLLTSRKHLRFKAWFSSARRDDKKRCWYFGRRTKIIYIRLRRWIKICLVHKKLWGRWNQKHQLESNR